ncbi:MAG: SMP-30/gluconolactonase/LRE family protein, partial [Verrucomicrobiota bacterium]
MAHLILIGFCLDRRIAPFNFDPQSRLREFMMNYELERIVLSFVLLAVAVQGVFAAAAPKPAAKQPTIEYPTFGTIERNDSALDKLLPPDAKIEKLAEGFSWAEGPVWSPVAHCVYFSDVPRNVVYKWKEGDTAATVFLQPSGYTGSKPRGGEPGSNGLVLDAKGRMVLCQHGDRRIARRELDGKMTRLVDYYNWRRFNSPNDAVYKSNGDLYFTDPPYGLEGNNNDPKKELMINGVYRLSKAGKVTLLTAELTFPNGIAFSPDEKTLYVAVSDPQHAVWMAYDVETDGTIANGRIFFDSTAMTKDKKGLPDGLKVDKAGNLFATGPGGVLVFSPDGKHLGTI